MHDSPAVLTGFRRMVHVFLTHVRFASGPDQVQSNGSWFFLTHVRFASGPHRVQSNGSCVFKPMYDSLVVLTGFSRTVNLSRMSGGVVVYSKTPRPAPQASLAGRTAMRRKSEGRWGEDPKSGYATPTYRTS